MLMAIAESGERIRATPNSIGYYPICQKDLITKCGTEKIWHFAHYPDANCNYGEGMGAWHEGWQLLALENGGDIEVPITDRFGDIHRADIVINKRVIEIQHSGISKEEIIARSDFYVGQKYRVDWLIDYTVNNFISVCDEQIKANGNHKKLFDCLFGKLYGLVLFDIGYDEVFCTNKMWIRKLFEHNDFGTKVRLQYIYDGYMDNKSILFLKPPYKTATRKLFEF